LELIGSRPSSFRSRHYAKCRNLLSTKVREFWDQNPVLIEQGIGSAGKFERYFALFRNRVLPWIHSQSRVGQLLRGGKAEERLHFYEKNWNTWRWQGLFRLFFSRTVMGWMGRDPAFFRYVEGRVSDRILERTRHALVKLNPAENPYLHWILTGTHGAALPLALREENFSIIRSNLDRLECRCQPLESFLDEIGPSALDACNLSDVFEYMSEENYHRLLNQLLQSSKPGARLAYWNMLVPRFRPESLAHCLRSNPKADQEWLARDKAFFYSRFVLEEVQP
jgi:S-adenosylmethionine-diacylglycerol 3-amino-3-carboxypropyl transferase